MKLVIEMNAPTVSIIYSALEKQYRVQMDTAYRYGGSGTPEKIRRKTEALWEQGRVQTGHAEFRVSGRILTFNGARQALHDVLGDEVVQALKACTIKDYASSIPMMEPFDTVHSAAEGWCQEEGLSLEAVRRAATDERKRNAMGAPEFVLLAAGAA